MRTLIPALCAMALLAGCDEGSSAAQDEADIAEIEAMHDMPAAQAVELERISYTDIEKNNLFGAGCGFAPDGGMAIMFLAQEERGYIKRDGKIEALAPDKGSDALPMPGYVKYDGSEFAIELSLDEERGKSEGIENTKFPGRMLIRDFKGRTVYEKDGTIGCGA